MKKSKKRQKPDHRKLPRVERPKPPGVFAIVGHTEHGPTFMPLGDAFIVFRRVDGVEFHIKFEDQRYLEIRETYGATGQLSTQSRASNVVLVGMSIPLEESLQ